MRIIVAGLGDIGWRTLKSLAGREGIQLVAVDLDEKRCTEVADTTDALVLHGDATDPALLQKAELREAEALVATTHSDAINTVIAILGHRAGVPKVIVKLTDFGLRPACMEIGVTAIVAPSIATAAQIESVLFGAERIDLSALTRGGLSLVEAEVAEAGVHVEDLEDLDGLRTVAVRRGEEEVFLPKPRDTLNPGDVVFALVESDEATDRLRRAVGGAVGD